MHQLARPGEILFPSFARRPAWSAVWDFCRGRARLKEYAEEIISGFLSLRRDVGYVSGMACLAAVILLEIPDPCLALQTFDNLMSLHGFL